MYERVQGNDMYNGATNPPFGATVPLNNVLLSNPGTSVLTGQTVSLPIPIVSMEANASNDYTPPVSIQFNLGVQRQLAKDTVLSVAYVGTQNRHQSEYTDINVPNPSLLPQFIAGTLNYDSNLPYLGYGAIKMANDDENGHYNALQATLHSQISHDLTLEAAYTYSKSIDPVNESGAAQDLQTVSNPYNRAYDYGPSPLDRRDVGILTFVYSLPFLRGNSGTRMLRSTLGGWQVSGIVTAETGLPLDITLGGTEGSNGLANGTNRPNVNGSVSMSDTLTQWFNSAAFSLPASGSWGTLPRNSVYGPGRDNWNISLFKSFVFSEARGSRLEFRVESFNTFNHTQWNGIGTNFSNGTTGTTGAYVPGSGQFGQVTSTYNPRNIQLGVKLMF
jgi:hypothetical protein